MIPRPWHLPYVDRLESRHVQRITLLVIHATESPDLERSRQAGELIRYPSGTGNCGHDYIDRDGTVWEFVPLERVAHHVAGQNQGSYGIELVNKCREGEPFPQAQLQALIALIMLRKTQCPDLVWVTRHSDLDRRFVRRDGEWMRRKVDPGPAFPWEWLVRELAPLGILPLDILAPLEGYEVEGTTYPNEEEALVACPE